MRIATVSDEHPFETALDMLLAMVAEDDAPCGIIYQGALLSAKPGDSREEITATHDAAATLRDEYGRRDGVRWYATMRLPLVDGGFAHIMAVSFAAAVDALECCTVRCTSGEYEVDLTADEVEALRKEALGIA